MAWSCRPPPRRRKLDMPRRGGRGGARLVEEEMAPTVGSSIEGSQISFGSLGLRRARMPMCKGTPHHPGALCLAAALGSGYAGAGLSTVG